MNNEKIARKFYDIFNKRDWQAVAGICDDKCVIKNMATGEDYKGVDGMKKWLQYWAGMCSDLMCDDVDVIGLSDNMVVIEGKAHGINDGQLFMPNATLPPTGKKLTVEWVDLLEFRNGKIAGIRCYYDTGRIMSQLGLGGQVQATRPTPGVVR